MESLEDLVTTRALGLIEAGVPEELAVKQALGQIVPELEAGYQWLSTEVASISAVVSPWMWILSVSGFVLALWNRHQIQKMYGSWKRARQTHS